MNPWVADKLQRTISDHLDGGGELHFRTARAGESKLVLL